MTRAVVNQGAGDIIPEDTGVPSGGNGVPSGGNPVAIQRITKQFGCIPEDTNIPSGGNPATVQRIKKGPMNYASPLSLAA